MAKRWRQLGTALDIDAAGLSAARRFLQSAISRTSEGNCSQAVWNDLLVFANVETGCIAPRAGTRDQSGLSVETRNGTASI